MIIVKRVCLISFLISILAVPAIAQKKFEIAINTGLALPISGSSIPNVYERDTQGNQTAIITTCGAGLNVGATGAYNLSPHFGLGLNVNHVFGIAGTFDQYPTKNTLKPSTTSITPTIKIATGNDKKFNWYAKMGLSLVFAKLDFDVKVEDMSGVAKYEFSGKPALGWLSGVGTDIKLGRLKLFAELELRMVTWNPDKLTNTENFGGTLNPTVEYQKYVPAGSPSTKQLPLSLPFNSIALNFGIKL